MSTPRPAGRRLHHEADIVAAGYEAAAGHRLSDQQCELLAALTAPAFAAAQSRPRAGRYSPSAERRAA